MAKSVTNFSGNGVSDWLIQRVSAVVLAVYFVVIAGWALFAEGGFNNWHHFMMSMPMKVFSILAVLSLVGHCWVGIWSISTDYIKPACIRIGFQLLVALALFVYLIWALTIFWG